MNKNQKFVITINRELGSGGRTVGRKLAEKLNVPFYDKALIKELKEKYHLTTEEVEKVKGGKQWWREFINSAMYLGQGMNETWYYNRMTGNGPHLVTDADMYAVEKSILENVAQEESCIIAGRSAFSVFKEHPNHLSIFIQAPIEYRVKRIMGKQDLSEDEAKKVIEKVDGMRENYVKKFTGTSRYDAHNYDLVINMEGKSEDEIVEFILNYIK